MGCVSKHNSNSISPDDNQFNLVKSGCSDIGSVRTGRGRMIYKESETIKDITQALVDNNVLGTIQKSHNSNTFRPALTRETAFRSQRAASIQSLKAASSLK